ncbi:MAG TPA: efflux RND transporter permease subunit, partial [Gemmataceae bacterium]|nr:efflux RND transporter permease subunit [Gemmataceae bacterium]
NPTVLAMDHPITLFMLIVGLLGLGVLAFHKMQVNIFPKLHTPKIYVYLDFIGMSPDQIEGFIINELELYFQYVDGVKDIKSRNIQQVGLVELSFFHGTDMGQAMGQVVAMSDRAMSWMPPGALPPMIMRMDEGSVPLGYLVFRSKGHKTSIGKMGDLANNIIRPLVQKKVPGTVAISPFGPNMRSIVVNVDPQKLLEYNLNPQHVVDALKTGNVVVPFGNLYVKDMMPMVANDATIVDIHRLGNIPIKLGQNVYLRDVATLQDATDITYGYALVDGENAIHLPIIKKPEGSALKVVDDVKKALPIFNKAVPSDVHISFEFDETPTVLHAVESVATEGAIGAGLTGLMILLFLRDWRSVLVVVGNIPLALTGSLCGLWVTKNSINIMSLGGMALAIGILVDEATVTIENTHVQMNETPHIATAVLRAAQATAVPRLLALLCILSVFIPAFVMEDPLRALFMPLTLAVGFAMISSYLLSSTYVPIMSVYLLKHEQKDKKQDDKKPGLAHRMFVGYGKMVSWFIQLRWWVVPIYLVGCAAILGVLGLEIGRGLFPPIDEGKFVLRFRPPAGSSYELTREMAVECLEVISREAGAENMEISLGFAGQVAPNFGIDNMVLFMRGPDDGWLRVALKEDSGIKLNDFREKLRKVLPERVVPWMAKRLEHGGMAKDEAEEHAKKCTFAFQPGDIVSEVMSFGATKPIAVRMVGTDYDKVRKFAEKVKNELTKIPALRDIEYDQTLDYPTVELNIDRELAGLIGITPMHIKRSMVMATSSTRFTNLNYWINPKTGFDYLVQIQMPPLRLDKPSDVEELPLESVNVNTPMMIRDVIKNGQVTESVRPGEYDRDMSQRYLTVGANVEGEDMGRAADQVREAVKDAGQPPRGVRIEEQGELPPMKKMFEALGIGLGVAVFVIFVLLTAYFESPRLALASIGAVPGVLVGIVVILYFSGTTLNIESFMGSIMCLGVSVSNSVMMVTFMDEHWKAGKTSTQAAHQGASERLRPILMTACAMSIGMVPMSLALERGSQIEAPLGRAVIGGLVMSTFATLLVLPSIFAILIGSKKATSPSLYPDNPKSSHFDPQAFAEANGSNHESNGQKNGAKKEKASTKEAYTAK